MRAVQRLMWLFALSCELFPLALGRAQNADNYVNSGYTRVETGDPDGAFADFSRAIALDPKNAEAFVGRSLARLRRDDLDGAAADQSRALELNPEHAMAHVYCGEVKEAKGDHEGALADVTRAVELSPLSSIALLARCSLEFAARDYAAALEDCNRAVQATPRWPEAFAARAAVEEATGDLKAAMSDGNQTVWLSPKRAIGYNLRGSLKVDAGDYKGAMEDYAVSMKLDPKSPRPYRLRGIANVLQKHRADALADFRRCRDLGKGHDIYVSFAIWILRSRLGTAGDAGQEIASDLAATSKTAAGIWAHEVGEFLLGRLSEADFIAAARSPSPTTEAEHLCEADYYAGMKKLLAGDKPGAAALFHGCISTRQRTYDEYKFTTAELGELESTPTE